MKKLDTSNITASTGFPVKSGTLQHLQAAYTEALAESIKSMIGLGYDPTKVYVLSGLINSGTGLTYAITAGSVFFNGEVFNVPAFAGTIVGPNVLVGIITTSFFSAPNADPVQFTDGVPRNVHQIRQIVLQSGLPGSGTANYTDFLKGNSAQIPVGGSIGYKPPTGDTSEFDGTGLGIAPNVQGWALCNGSNGTDDEQGLVEVMYKVADADFGTLNAAGGAKTFTLVQNQLPSVWTAIGMTIGEAYTGSGAGPVPGNGSNNPTSHPQNLTNPGGGQPVKFLVPFITKLRIQRIY